MVAPLVGRAVAVSDNGIRGPFFSPDVHAHLLTEGIWSDSLCDCWHDKQYRGSGDWWFVVLCPSCAVYAALSRIGTVSHPFESRYGPVSASTVGWLMLLCFISDIARIAYGIGFLTTALLLACILRGVVIKVNVNESLLNVILKATFCSTCFYSQICRHVDRLQGFTRYQETISAIEKPLRSSVSSERPIRRNSSGGLQLIAHPMSILEQSETDYPETHESLRSSFSQSPQEMSDVDRDKQSAVAVVYEGDVATKVVNTFNGDTIVAEDAHRTFARFESQAVRY